MSKRTDSETHVLEKRDGIQNTWQTKKCGTYDRCSVFWSQNLKLGLNQPEPLRVTVSEEYHIFGLPEPANIDAFNIREQKIYTYSYI